MSETTPSIPTSSEANAPHAEVPPTRMVFLGEDSLAEGFRAIGFEAHGRPSPADVDRVLRELLASRDKAFVIVDDDVMRMDVDNLKRVRREGGRIVVVAVPPLAAASPTLGSEVADRLASMFGGGNLMQPNATKDST